MTEKSVAILGAGITGLCCARHLQSFGIPYHIFEASDRVGGRVRTEYEGGYQFDAGFQVFLEGYDEFAGLVDFADLELGYFYSGAFLYDNQIALKLGNPLKEGLASLLPAMGGWATWGDKLKVLSLYLEGRRSGYPVKLTGQSTEAFLLESGFSPTILRRFFRPFMGDVFLDRELRADAGFFLYLLQKFAQSRASLPKNGMQAIPDLIAKGLAAGSISFHSRLDAQAGELSRFSHIVETAPAKDTLDGFAFTMTLYFGGSIERNPGNVLMLNVQDELVRNASILSEVQPAYAPSGQNLLSVTVDPSAARYAGAALSAKVLEKVSEWVGDVSDLRLLRYFEIPHALPRHSLGLTETPFAVTGNVISCGDAYAYPSLNGAAYSGRKVAEYLASL
jgi:Flavin containing amine oxidoreductase